MSCTDQESEIVRLAAKGDNSSFSTIFAHYLPIIRAVAKRYVQTGADFEDIVQEGVIGLYKAVKGFEPDKCVPFQAFALLCIRHQIINAVVKYSRQFEILSDFSADTAQKGEQNQDLILMSYPNPEDLVMGREGLETVKQFIKERLSGFEYDVLCLYLTGITYSKIAKKLGKNPKAVDNAISRIKSKLFKGLSDS